MSKQEENNSKAYAPVKREKDILQHMIDSAKNIHLVYLDRDFNFVRVNQAYADTCGYKPEEMIGKNHFALFPHEENEAIFKRARDMGVPAQFHDKPFIFPDQPTRAVTYWDWTLEPIKGKSGKVEGLVFSLVETTERKKAEEALQKAKEQTDLDRKRLETILATTPSAVVILEAPDGKFSYANRRALQLYGFDTLGLDLAENVAKVKARRADGSEYPIDKMPVSRSLRFGEEVRNEEMIIERPDGTSFPIIASTAPLRDMNGKITSAIVVFEDITEHKRAEEALIKSEKEYRSLFENMIDGFAYCQMIFDKNGKPIDLTYLEINDAFERITGLSRQQVIGRKITEAIPGTEKANPELFEIYGRVALTCQKEKFEIFFKPLKLWLSISAYCPRIGYFAAIFEDVTERKKSEQELDLHRKHLEELVKEKTKQLQDSERLAAIGATAGMVGHDIRNPLQSITSDLYLAKTELASTTDTDEKKNALESLQEIENNIDYINKIVQDLQDYARPLSPKKEEVDLKQIIEKLLAKNKIPNNIKTSIKLEEGTTKVCADPYYINRIMYNLIMNSVQAMPQGGELSIQAYKEGSDTIISVKDTGVGIPKEVQGKMFTAMFTTKAKGQGFGLPVVKRMIESLGGTVTFESQVGKGTTFMIRFSPRS
jgi:PAS domain S-box-containing protein